MGGVEVDAFYGVDMPFAGNALERACATIRKAQSDSIIDRLRSKRARYSERMSSSHEATPAIKMIIGVWYVDELGVRTREITARE